MKDKDVVTEALKIALVSFPLYWIYPILEVMGGSVRGMGYAISSMAVIIGCMCVIRVSLLAWFSTVYHSIEALAAVYPITWGCSAILFTTLFLIIIHHRIKKV